ncbi:MAG: hypothetical protein R2941_07805 [Desulfobacterales bacterium]
MNHTCTIRTTIVFGLICALFFKPLQMMLSPFLSWPMPFRISIWLCIFLYGILLARWGRKNIAGAVFPALILLIFAFLIPSLNAFLLLSLGVLSWIRSGICFPGSFVRTAGMEMLVCFGGGFLINAFAPRTGLSWALAVWLFFLMQSLYFILSAKESQGTSAPVMQPDAFEQARKQAEKILSGEI